MLVLFSPVMMITFSLYCCDINFFRPNILIGQILMIKLLKKKIK